MANKPVRKIQTQTAGGGVDPSPAVTGLPTVQDYRNAKNATNTTGESTDEQIQAALDAATEEINQITGVTWGAAADGTSRTFTATYNPSLYIWPCYDIESVVDQYGTTVSNSYYYAPTDEFMRVSNRLTPTGSYQFIAGRRYTVTAKYGSPETPEAIRQAIMTLASILRLKSPLATATTTEDQIEQRTTAEANKAYRNLIRAYTIYNPLANSRRMR